MNTLGKCGLNGEADPCPILKYKIVEKATPINDCSICGGTGKVTLLLFDSPCKCQERKRDEAEKRAFVCVRSK